MVDAHGAVTLLAERGLLDLSEIVDGEVRLVDVSRRNRNLHVLRRRRPSYVLKQGLGDERRQTVAHEAAIYEYIRALGDHALSAVLPTVVGYVKADCLLVLEFVTGTESLERRHSRCARYSTQHARGLAEALHTVHRATSTAKARSMYEQRFRTSVPWSLSSLYRPDASMVHELSNGSALAIRMIQSVDGFPELLHSVAEAWTPQCLIHGDLRFDNCLVSASEDSQPHRERTCIVDWELAQWGDPCWDAGAVLGGYLSSWLLACPINGETPLDAVVQLGRYRLPDMQRAAGAFWTTYRGAFVSTGATRSVSLQRAMRYAAVALLQSMFEELQANSELSGRAVCLAQLAFNVLSRPDEAAAHFLALPVAA